MKGNIFIKRPVMAISISVLILVIGLISLFTLPVEQYPDIAPPTVYVSANYTGADAEADLCIAKPIGQVLSEDVKLDQ